MQKTDKEIGLIRRSLLKLLTKLQEYALSRGSLYVYFRLTSIHFLLYYGYVLNSAKHQENGFEPLVGAIRRARYMMERNLPQHIKNNLTHDDIVFKLFMGYMSDSNS